MAGGPAGSSRRIDGFFAARTAEHQHQEADAHDPGEQASGRSEFKVAEHHPQHDEHIGDLREQRDDCGVPATAALDFILVHPDDGSRGDGVGPGECRSLVPGTAPREEAQNAETNELLPSLEDGLVNDGMVTGVKDAATGKTIFTSGRHYTDVGNALRFAREQGQPAVYNWNRDEEVPVTVLPPKTIIEPTATSEVEG